MELPLQVPNETLNQHYYTELLNLRSSVLFYEEWTKILQFLV